MRCAITEQSRGFQGHPPPKILNFTLPEMQSSALLGYTNKHEVK